MLYNMLYDMIYDMIGTSLIMDLIYVLIYVLMRTTPIKLPRFHRHAIADSPEIFTSMTPQEILANFGGRQRLQRLGKLLQAKSLTSRCYKMSQRMFMIYSNYFVTESI